MKNLYKKAISLVCVIQCLFTYHAFSNPLVSIWTHNNDLPERALGIDVGLHEDHRELFRNFGLVFCGATAASYYVRHYSLIRDEAEAQRKKMSPQKKALLARLGNLRMGKLSDVDKASNVITKLWTGTIIGFSGAICGVYLTKETIDFIEENPTIAYNTNEVFRDMVDKFGLDTALEKVGLFREKTIEERFDILESEKPEDSDESSESNSTLSSENDDFFGKAQTVEIKK